MHQECFLSLSLSPYHRRVLLEEDAALSFAQLNVDSLVEVDISSPLNKLHPEEVGLERPFASWNRDFYPYQSRCHVPTDGAKYAYVIFYYSTPPEKLIDAWNGIVETLRHKHNTIADIVVVLPNTVQMPTPSKLDPAVKVVHMSSPVKHSEFPPNLAHALSSRPNCCGYKEFFKLNAFRLAPYKRVIVIDG